MSDITTVAIVVDPHAGALIRDLSQRMHVWANETPENRAALEAVWASSDSSSVRMEATWIVFDPSPPDRVVAHMLSTIDTHHASYSQAPQWCRAEVYGARLTPELQADFNGFGFDQFEHTADGFVATRSRPFADMG